MLNEMYKKNILALSEYYDINIENTSPPNISLENTKDGLYTFKYHTIENKQVYVHSKYNIARENQIIFKHIDFNKDALYIVYGLGMGYHIDDLFDKISSRSVIFVIEKEENIIKNYCMYNDVREKLVNRNIFLFSGSIEEITAQMSKRSFAYNIMPLMVNIVNVILPSYELIYGMEWIKNLNKKIIDTFEQVYFMLGNDIEDTIIGLKNNILNIIELAKSPSISLLKDSYSNIPAIIVSAGPSLNKNVHLLKEVQGKALIFATDATLSVLEKNGILPDAVFSIERGYKTYEAFYKDKEIDDRIVFVGPPVVRPEIFETIKGKKLVALKKGEMINEWINDVMEDDRLLLMGASCAHICFSFAQHLGCNPIIFVGQDLAYTPQGVTHAEGVAIKEIRDLNSQDIVFVEDIYGNKVPTTTVLKQFLIWFENQITNDKSGRVFIDATEGGARIRGTKILSLNEAINLYCNNKEIKPLTDIIPNINPNWYHKVIKVVEQLKVKKNDFYKLRRMAGAHILNLDKLERQILSRSKLTSNNIKRLLKELNKAFEIEQFILNDYFISTFLQPAVMSTIAMVRKLGNEITENVVRENFLLQKKMIAAVVGTCYIVEKEIDNIICELLKKLDEEDVK